MYYSSADDAAVIFRDAAKLNLTGPGHIWLVTEQALDVPGVPVGALGLQQMHAANEAAHIRDSLYVGLHHNKGAQGKSLTTCLFKVSSLVSPTRDGRIRELDRSSFRLQ